MLLPWSGPFLLFSQASLKNFEGRVCGCFGESADAILALYPVTTNAEAGEAWAEVYGAVFFDYPHYCLNRLAAENGIPVYEYYFSGTTGGSERGTAARRSTATAISRTIRDCTAPGTGN